MLAAAPLALRRVAAEPTARLGARARFEAGGAAARQWPVEAPQSEQALAEFKIATTDPERNLVPRNLHRLSRRHGAPRLTGGIVLAYVAVFGRIMALVTLIAPGLDSIDHQVVGVLVAVDPAPADDHPFRDFYAAELAAGHVKGIPGFHRHFWASCYRDLMRLRGADDFAEHAERVLEPAC